MIVGPGTSIALIEGRCQATDGVIACLRGGDRDGVDVVVDGWSFRDLRLNQRSSRIPLVAPGEILVGSVAKNIDLARPEVTQSDVQRSIQIAGLESAVRHWPRGWQTELSHSGHPLDAVEQRLLMVARAAAARPGAMILDHLCDGLPIARVRTLLASLRSAGVTALLITDRDDMASLCEQTLSWPTGDDRSTDRVSNH